MSKKSNRPQFRLKPACAALMLVFAAQQAAANPVGGVVASGQASFAVSGSTLTVTNTPGAIINWQSFSIAANETTRFAQQSAASTVLNRVATTGNPSSILGTLSSNGRVFLVNPGGVIFGQGATVDVAGLVATTLNLSDADFLAGRYSFARVPGAQSISNAGNITAQSGGEIYLIAPDVKNTGVISAPNGEILLAAGHEVELVNSFDPNLRVSITAPAGDATNVGKLIVESGSLGLFGTVVRNSGTVSADSAVSQGGKIVFRASQRAEAGGMIGANGTGGGSVSVSAAHSAEPTMPGVVVQTGSIEANGASGAGGSVSLNGDSILSSAAISVNGAAAGGQISVQAAGRALSTSSARYSANSATGSGGDILVSANVSNYTSGSYSATGAIGGNITLAGNEIKVAGAQLDASGTRGGGTIRVGGLMHGAAGFGAQGIALANADNVIANSAARFAADAVQTGNGGEVVLWSDQSMRFSGNISARGGALGGNGGMAEVSGLTSLGYTGLVDLSASRGAKGTLLLDPYNITIAAGNGALPASPYQEIIDLTPGAGEGFGGFQTRELANGNILITSPNDSLNGSSSGAVYLYDTAGLLLSALVGGTANDRVGNGGITELNSGHYLVYSPNWSGNLGAVTWMHGSSGQLSGGAPGGAVSNTNSLTGSAAGDQVGSGGATWLNGWNYAIRSTLWGSGGVAANARGAVTWINGETGELSNSTIGVPVYGGAVGLTNSLVGSTAGDKVGTNTLIGYYGTPHDSSGLTVSGGNLIVSSNNWNNGGAAVGAGAVTWMSGATGALSDGATGGAVSGANSLVGSAAGDRVGTMSVSQWYGPQEISGVTTLSTSNIMVRSGLWGSAGVAANALGAVTWMSGATGFLGDGSAGGAVGPLNSLVGSTLGDRVGSNFMTLANGNVVVTTSNWTQPAGAGPALANVGAVTWISGATGLLAGGSAGGAISSSNSLVGDTANDRVGNGGIYLVGNGNYLVRSGNWNGNRGAVTWVNGAAGVAGAVSSTNSIVGSLAGDMVGAGWVDVYTNDPGLVVLPNGHFVVVSSRWGGGRGAVTWGNGATGTSGFVSGIATTGNALSLVGAVGASYVGAQGIQVQTGGSNFVVKSPWFDFNTLVDNGAVTWMNGTTGALSNGTFGGAVDGTNSLMGGFSLDNVGAVTALNSGNFMATTPVWNGGSPSTGLGAVTGINGATGWLAGPTSGGVISSANSVLGSSPGDMLGLSIIELANGNVLGITPNWDNGSVQNAGAVTWVNGTTGALSNGTFGGAIGAANSLVGSATGDLSGSTVTQLSGGNLLLRNPGWDNANTLAADAGAVTWMNGSTGKLADLSNGGAIGAANSLVGSATGDMLGSSMIEHYLNLNILLLNPNWDNGGTLNAGAVTWMNGATGELSSSTVAAPVYGGAISAANSLLGSVTSDSVGSGGITQLGNGNFVIASPSWYGSRGAATWMNGATGALSGGGTGGIISASNSLVGSVAYDSVGTGIISFSDDSTYWNYVVRSNWGGGVGALTWVNGTTGLTSDSSGTISATNSLVGSIINDTVGASVANYLSNGNVVFSNQYWGGGRGAVTWMNPANGRLADGLQGGVVSASNSLVGTTPDDIYTAGDNIGSGGITQITDYSTFWNYVVLSPNWTNGAATAAGAVTLGNGATGTVGSVTFANSLVGSVANDRVGSGGITIVSDGATFWNYIVRSPDWGGAGGYQTAKGAVTWVNGRTGVLSNGLSGDAVDALNSLIGSLAGDQVGVASFSYDSALNGVNVLSNNNLLIRSQHWNGGRSALTWMNGATGRLAGDATGGTVAATNSLLGSAVNDDLGNGVVGVTELTNGNWVITSPGWGAVNRQGAATWMNGSTGQLADGLFGGVVAASNSLVGSATTPGLLDYFCDCGNTGVAGGVLALSDGNYVVYRQDFSPDVGALTWGNGGSGTVGTVASNNSLLVFVNDVQEMSGQPGTVLVGSGAANGGTGGVYLIGAGAGGASGPLFADSPATDATVGASWIEGTLNLGTNLVLQANNDITQDADAAITATGLGSLTLQAGRSVILNGAINIAGALAITANDPGADSLYRDIGPAVLDTTLATLTAGQINLANSGGDILLNDLTATAAGLTAAQNAISIQSAGWVYSGGVDATSGSIHIAGDAGVDLDFNDWTPAISAQAGNVNISSSAGDVMATYWADVTGQNVSISAAGNIALSDWMAVVANGGNVVLTSDSDGAGGGGIYLGSSSGINSNGGDIWMGGGGTTTRALGNGTVTGGVTFNSGITVLGDIAAGAGNVTMYGEGANNNFADGITFAGGTLSSNGIVTIDGIAHGYSTGTAPPNEFAAGVDFLGAGTRLTTQTGTVTVTGLNTALNADPYYYRADGIMVETGAIVETTGTGTLTFNGTANSFNTSWGLGVLGTIQTTAAGGGAITLNGTNASGLADGGVVILGGNVLSGGGEIRMVGAGLGGSVGIVSGSTIGGASSGNILIKANNAGPIDLASGASVNAGTSALTIALAGGSANDNGNAITAGALRLLGTGTFNLGGANNNIGTLAANVTGNVAYRDTDGFAIGSVTSFDGTGTTTTTGVAATDVTFNAGGAITAGTGTVTANTLDVISAGGIALNTAVGGIHTSNTGAGNTLISNTGALTITGMTETSGSITLNNAGSVAVTGGMSANGATLTTSGIALTASGAASDISITGAGGVNTYSGAISLNAGQDIVHSGGAQQINSSSGTLSLTAGRDILHTGSTTNQINTFSGAMMLMAGRDIIHADADQINSYSGAMLLMAGRDFAHSGAAGQINNNSGSLAITAGQDFTHSASGQINTNSGALTITTGRDFFHSASGQVNTASGAMTINAGNNFLYTGSGQINTASGAQAITVGGDLTVSGGSSRVSSSGGQTIAARDIFVGPAGGRLIAYSGAQNIAAGRDMSAVMNGGSAYIESQSGLQTITVGRDLLVQVTGSAGGTEAHIEGGAGQVITVGGNLTMNALDNDQTRINANGGDQTITVGGNMTLNAAQDIAHVQSLYGTQTVTVRGNLDLLGSSAYMRGALGQAITVGGNLNSQGGRISSGAATALQVGNDLILAGGQVWSDGPLTGSVGRDVTITGAPYSLAGLFGTPDIGSAASPFSVGGVIRLNDGSTGGGAEIHSGLPYSIWIHFPNLTGGGYFVNGVESAVSGGSSGFYANGLPAVLDSNLHITYRPLAIISQPVLDFIAQSSFTPAVFPVNTLQPPNVNLLLAAAPPGAGEEQERDDPDLAALAAAALGPDPEAPPAPLPVCQ